jgi:uncharacterized protein (TIGR00369 family)
MDNNSKSNNSDPGVELAGEYLERLQQMAKGTFWELLGCKLEAVELGRVTVTLRVEDHHLNTIGILHGGVHASLLDNTMGIAAMLARPNEKVVTTNLNMHYLTPLQKGIVHVTGIIIHQTRKIITTQGEIHDEAGHLGSWCSASYRVV